MPKKDFSKLERMNTPLNNIIAPAAAPATPPATQPKTQPEKATETATAGQKARYSADIDRYEPRSRRVQLLMRPSIYTGIQHIADQQHISMNHLIENILADHIAQTKAEYEERREQRRAKREQGKG